MASGSETKKTKATTKKVAPAKKATTKVVAKKATTKVVAKKVADKKTAVRKAAPKKPIEKKKTTTTKKVIAPKKTKETKVATPKKVVAKKEPVKKVVAKKPTTKKVAEVKKQTKKPVVKKESVAKKTTPVKTTKSVKPAVVTIPRVIEEDALKYVSEQKTKTQVKTATKENYLVYAFLLCTVSICLYVMGKYKLGFDGVFIPYSAFLFPVVFFISNIITKKFDFFKSLMAILVSTIVLVVFIYLSKYLNAKVIDYAESFGQVFAYIISQLLNIMVYYYIIINTKAEIKWLYLSYLFSVIAYFFISILFMNNIIITPNFWTIYICSILVSGMVAVLLTVFDSLIKRGE